MSNNPNTYSEVIFSVQQSQTQPTQLAEKNLFDCIREEDLDTLRRYVDRGGPVHVADTLGDTSLLVAASTGNPEVVKVGLLNCFCAGRFGGMVGWWVGVGRSILSVREGGEGCWSLVVGGVWWCLL